MKDSRFWFFLALAVLVALIGCAMTDQQIQDIANAAGTAATTGAQAVIGIAAPGIPADAVSGIAGALGVAVVFGMRQILLLIRKKPAA